ncbi:DnaD domain protein [Enterococcus faecalis]|uniref:DnaD domain-containing protein n=1 Tax=Enterococcus faecalis TaxID=1351 RepID=UPI0003534516|nr:DnaD domain protein [Enterococcus faecalis]EPH89655.1 DnaD domain protein [Enterococcus faecalis F01966]MCU2241454.1 DnaD domain protein [Enterococcus faecalis]
MAERRMFAKTIIDSDAFLDMPLSAQCLYFHLSMRADDDGFINNPKKIQRMIGCGDDDLKLLMAKRFILVFDSGVIVIKHWKIHNYIRNDRYKPTLYQEEKAELVEKNSKAYTFKTEVLESESHLGIPDDNHMVYQTETNRQPNDNQMDTQVRLGKDRLELGKGSREEGLKKIYHYYESNGFGTLAQKTMQDFDYWITDFEKIGATQENAVELIIHALGIAIDRNKRNYGYANAILKDWEQNKYLSVKDVEANDMMREQKKIIEEQKSNTGHSEYDDLGF